MVIVNIVDDFRERGFIDENEFQRILKRWQKGVERRKREARRLLQRLESISSEFSVIVAEDFNAEPDSPEIIEFKETGGFIDTHLYGEKNKKFTWDPHHNSNIDYSARYSMVNEDFKSTPDLINAYADRMSRRIDYIFLSRHFKSDNIVTSKIAIDSTVNGIHASDHFGVYAEVSLPDKSNDTIELTSILKRPIKAKIEPLPILMYDTDIGFGYGGKVFLLNLFRHGESFDIVAFNSTKGERWYRFVFSIPDFGLRQGKIYPLALDIVVDYDKWIKNSFFEVGNDSRFENREYYTREPFEISTTISRGFSRNMVAQIEFRYKSIRNFNFTDDSNLLKLFPPQNAGTARYGSIYVIGRYDTKNSFINPSRGMVLQGEVEYAPELTFSNVSFVRYAGWLQWYTILFYPKTVLAIRSGLQIIDGDDLSVQVLLSTGGSNTLRGNPQDRFLDKVSGVINLEIRFPIYRRLEGVAGYDIGQVWNSLSTISLADWKSDHVVGLRYYMDTFVIRMDVGFGREGTGFYFNFGHVF